MPPKVRMYLSPEKVSEAISKPSQVIDTYTYALCGGISGLGQSKGFSVHYSNCFQLSQITWIQFVNYLLNKRKWHQHNLYFFSIDHSISCYFVGKRVDCLQCSRYWGIRNIIFLFEIGCFSQEYLHIAWLWTVPYCYDEVDILGDYQGPLSLE